jgi:hypothetical protein
MFQLLPTATSQKALAELSAHCMAMQPHTANTLLLCDPHTTRQQLLLLLR